MRKGRALLGRGDGEVVGFRQDRTEAAATAVLREELTGDSGQGTAVTVACTDMHRPCLNARWAVLMHAEVVLRLSRFSDKRLRRR